MAKLVTVIMPKLTYIDMHSTGLTNKRSLVFHGHSSGETDKLRKYLVIFFYFLEFKFTILVLKISYANVSLVSYSYILM